MTYRGQDPERALEVAEEERVTRAAAELDEDRALSAIRDRPGFLVICIASGAGATVVSAITGAMIGSWIGGAFGYSLTGLLVGFALGGIGGLVASILGIARWSR